ncbi:MAG: hypothetical protein R3356_08610, partial [Eudoraea sp.]|nr:hypothetical protein [Eudoraea sp.]
CDMKVLQKVFVIFLLLGCSTKVDPDSLPLLNGYWEIEKVVFPDGSTKSYKVNTSIEYIEIKGREGFRKKMQPQFDGSFKTSNDAEQFIITEVQSTLILQYANAENSWEETLIALSKENFEVRSEEGVAYHYKRYEPLELD